MDVEYRQKQLLLDESKTLFVTSYFVICIMETSANGRFWKVASTRVNDNTFRASLPLRFKGIAKEEAGSVGIGMPVYKFAIDIPGQRAVLFTKHGYSYWDYNAAKMVYKVTVNNDECTVYGKSFDENCPSKLPLVNPKKHSQTVLIMERITESDETYYTEEGKKMTSIQLKLSRKKGTKYYWMNAALSKGNPRVTIPLEGYLFSPYRSYAYSDIEILTEMEANSLFRELLSELNKTSYDQNCFKLLDDTISIIKSQ